MTDNDMLYLGALCTEARPMRFRELVDRLGRYGSAEAVRVSLDRLIKAELALNVGRKNKPVFAATNKGRALLGYEVLERDAAPIVVDPPPAVIPDLFDPMVFASAVRVRMAETGQTQDQVARIAGVTPPALSQMLNYKGGARVETFLRLLWWMGVRKYAVDAFAPRGGDA